MTSISLSGITHCYESDPGRNICSNLSLRFSDGEFVVIVGPSGCGKSTLLRLIAGLERPIRGSVKFGADDVTTRPARARNVAMVFQSYALYPHLNVRSNLELTLKIGGVSPAERAERVARVSRYLEIDELLNKRPAQLSGGQRQRVAMGRALVRNPAVFLFDEPLSNLDAELRGRLRAQIKKLHREFPATKIYVTHDQVEAMTLADRIVVLSAGEIQQIGTPAEIYTKPANVFVAQFFGSPQMNLFSLENLSGLVQGESLYSSLQQAQRHFGNAQIGIRPEHLFVVPEREPGFAAVVTDFENLGSSYTLTCETPAGLVRVTGAATEAVQTRKPPAGDEFRIGAPLRIGFQPSSLHWFDERLGSRLDGLS
jgi:ABC-type sugar transport system ATPase subunit